MKQGWQTLEVFLENCKSLPIPPMLRLLLASDGSTTRSFNSLFLMPVRLELVSQHEMAVDGLQSSQLGVSRGEKAIERAVWLKVVERDKPERKLLYAVSTIPISHCKPDLYQELQIAQKPLGQIIEERGLATHRDCFKVACLPFPQVARGLALKEDTLFWARRYRLSISEEISVLIREVFSPGLSLSSS